MLHHDPRLGSLLLLLLLLRFGLLDGLGLCVDCLCDVMTCRVDQLVLLMVSVWVCSVNMCDMKEEPTYVSEDDTAFLVDFGLIVVVDAETGEEDFVLVGR